MKNLTDFRKMLETGVDPRLPIKRPPSTKILVDFIFLYIL